MALGSDEEPLQTPGGELCLPVVLAEGHGRESLWPHGLPIIWPLGHSGCQPLPHLLTLVPPWTSCPRDDTLNICSAPW